MNERKEALAKKMLEHTKIMKRNIKSKSWELVRINLIDIKYMLNQVDMMEDEDEE